MRQRCSGVPFCARVRTERFVLHSSSRVLRAPLVLLCFLSPLFLRSAFTFGSHGENSCDWATAAGVSFIMKLWEEAEVGRTWCCTAASRIWCFSPVRIHDSKRYFRDKVV
ncbi:uncharacterized protein ACIQIH_007466 isoform 2-T2 [Cyanocitta cristata]